MTENQTSLSKAEMDHLSHVYHRTSHDLKAPVRAISQIADWITEELEESDAAQSATITNYLALLSSRSDRLQMLITNLATYSSVGLSTRLFDGNWADLVTKLRATLPLPETFTFSTDFAVVPKISLNDLEILLGVFLSNATKHHHLKAGHISLSVLPQSNGCLLTVEDDGPGIPPDQLAQTLAIFGMLNRQDVVEGSGLGFSIAQRIADHYHGTFSVCPSRNTTGCSASVWLPA